MIQEKTRSVTSGYLALALLPALTLIFGWLFVGSAQAQDAVFAVTYLLLLLAVLVCFKGFFMVNPNQAKVLQLFGTYVGSVRQTGLRWANPFYSKSEISLRVRNFESEALKVNDSSGNPIVFQAQAIVAARTQIVDGAVGMVKMALTQLEAQGVVHLDEERKASMVCNLLVVLCGEENVQPVLNAGSLY